MVQLLEIPTAHTTEGGVDEEVVAVLIENEMCIAQPAGIAGEDEALLLFERGDVEQADVIITEGGEGLSIG